MFRPEKPDGGIPCTKLLRAETGSFGAFEPNTATAGRLAPTLGEPVPFQSEGYTWIRFMGGRMESLRNGHWLSGGKYVLQTYISNHFGGDPLVIAP